MTRFSSGEKVLISSDFHLSIMAGKICEVRAGTPDSDNEIRVWEPNKSDWHYVNIRYVGKLTTSPNGSTTEVIIDGVSYELTRKFTPEFGMKVRLLTDVRSAPSDMVGDFATVYNATPDSDNEYRLAYNDGSGGDTMYRKINEFAPFTE